jgi:adenine-specific DNA methylase
MTFPWRLFEGDLAIGRIPAHARREKAIRHGHRSTLHTWGVRRPLAACRAVICAALWPDPADEHCGQSFREAAVRLLTAFARRVFPDKITDEKARLQQTADLGTLARWEALASGRAPLDAADPDHLNTLRHLFLDFIADFANWDNSTVPAYLETSRALTQAAHEALGGEPGTRPLVVDPFAGGSIPLEALRVGADAFASDLNPVAVLLNKVVLEYIPKYGQKLADEVRKSGRWIKEQAEKELAEFYPKDPDGATPIAYLWARTIRCEGAGCGAEVPLMRSLWLAKKANRSVALKLIPNPKAKRVDFEIIGQSASGGCKPPVVGEGTVKRGSATCPCCRYTTPVRSVREQLKKRRGGAADARLLCVVMTRPSVQGRFYRLPTEGDLDAVAKAAKELQRRKNEHTGPLSLVPEELTPRGGGSGAGRAFSQRHYGMEQFCDLFTQRQLLVLTTLAPLVRQTGVSLAKDHDPGIAEAVQAGLGLCLNRVADLSTSLCRWKLDVQCPVNLFARQAIPIVWDFAESVALSDSSGAIIVMTDRFADVLEQLGSDWLIGDSTQCSASKHTLPNDVANALVTDPPYYDAVPYADLSDFFYVWLKRTLPPRLAQGFTDPLTPKIDEWRLMKSRERTKRSSRRQCVAPCRRAVGY